jgi:hypothetical protein
MAEDDGLDCLDLLKETPAILRGLMRELSHDDAHWKAAPDRFSVAECSRTFRIRRATAIACASISSWTKNLPEFEQDDAQMYLGLYRDAGAEDSFDHFEEQRVTNIEFLRTLGAQCRRTEGHAQSRGRDYALADAAWMGNARSGAHSPDCRAGACAQALAGGGALGEFYQLRPWKAPLLAVAAHWSHRLQFGKNAIYAF